MAKKKKAPAGQGSLEQVANAIASPVSDPVRQSPEVLSEQRPAPSPVVRANVRREVVFSPTFASLYTNDSQVQISPWDVRIVFGQITDAPTKDQARVLVTATGEVRMSPQHAKRLVQVLQAQLMSYERQIGPIPMPRE